MKNNEVKILEMGYLYGYAIFYVFYRYVTEMLIFNHKP